MVSEDETDLREKPCQGNLWLIIKKVSWQRRLPTFSERTPNLSRKIEFTAGAEFCLAWMMPCHRFHSPQFHVARSEVGT